MMSQFQIISEDDAFESEWWKCASGRLLLHLRISSSERQRRREGRGVRCGFIYCEDSGGKILEFFCSTGADFSVLHADGYNLDILDFI